jgi:signal transduction histidine kinase
MRILFHAVGIGFAGLLTAHSGDAMAAPTPAGDLSAGSLTNAIQILNLSAQQAAQDLPVQLQGVVVDLSEPLEQALILQDHTASIYLLANSKILAPYHQGEVLKIIGVTSKGEFAPCVRVKEAQKLGDGRIPKAHPATYQQLITGALDAQYVEISGVVRQCLPELTGAQSQRRWRIVLGADGSAIPVRIPLPQDPRIQVDAEVTIRAVCYYQFNQKRQAISPILHLPFGASVQINKPAPSDPYAAPVRSSIKLLQYSRDNLYGHRVHVQGVVTLSEPGSLVWIRDTSSGLRIQITQKDTLQPGDEIDALGFPGYGSSVPVLEDAIFRKIRTSPPPVPLRLNNYPEAYDHQDDLVSMTAMLTDIQPVIGGLLLTMEHQDGIFKAILKLPPGANPLPPWQVGSLVQVAGICDVIYDNSRPVTGTWHPQSFQILLRDPSDLTVLKARSWWTARHVILALGLLAGAALVVSGVVMLRARKRLNEQAQRRAMAEAEFSAILSERNRMAREIHDTLAQGLTATSVQLQLVNIHASGTSDTLIHHLDKAQQLVRESLEEARNSIWNMRSQVLETGDLANALKNILEQLSDGGLLKTHFEVTGRVRRLPANTENNLLRLGQEAITNAIKHARAKNLRVMLEFGEKHFSLRVADDGQGFDPNNPAPSEGGFGLVGMRERAKELQGDFKIRATPNQGTEISLWIPLASA